MLSPVLFLAAAVSAADFSAVPVAPAESGPAPPAQVAPGPSWNDFALRRAVHLWWMGEPERALEALEQRDPHGPESDRVRADFLHAYGLRGRGERAAFLDEAVRLLREGDAPGWAASVEPLLALDSDPAGADPSGVPTAPDPVAAAPGLRATGRADGLTALAERRWADAYGALAAVEDDWTREGTELARLESAAENGDVDELWNAWKSEGDGPGRPALERERIERAARDLVSRLLDLRDDPPDRPLRLHPADFVLTDRAAWLPTSIQPPAAGERRALGEAQDELARARRSLEEGRRRLEDEHGAHERDARYFGRGYGHAQDALFTSEDVARRADLLLARAAEIAAQLSEARDEETRRVAVRTAAFTERARRNLVVARALRRFHVEGPTRHEVLPAGIPSPKEILDLEMQLVTDLEQWFAAFAAIAPDLVARSHDEIWLPRAKSGPGAIAALAAERAKRARRVSAEIAATRDAAADPSRFAELEQRLALDDKLVTDRTLRRDGLRVEIGKRALADARTRHRSEGEGIAYALAVATQERGVAGGDTEMAQELRREAARRYDAFLADFAGSPARSEVRFRLADARLQVARDEFRANVERFLGNEPTADDWSRPELAPFVDYGPALEQYLAILEEDPEWAHRDAVLFHAGMIFSDETDRRGTELLQQLVTRHPQSRHAPEAHLRLGDQRFDNGDWLGCLPHFEQAAATASPEHASIALYKIAWAQFSLDRFEESARAYVRLLDHYADHPESAVQTDLQEESLDHLVHSLARGGGAPAYVRLFDTTGPRLWEQRTLTNLGQLLRSFSLFEDAADCDRLWLDRWPNDEGALAAAQRLVETRERADTPDAALAMRLELAPRFRSGTVWSAAQPDSLRIAGDTFARDSYKTVALHHHHAARENAAPDDWRAALGLYETLLEGWPAHEDTPTFHYYAGEAASALKDHPLAVAHFDDAAAAPGTPFATDAAWHSIAARDAWYESTRPAAAPDSAGAFGEEPLARGLMEAIDGFVSLHPLDERSPDLMWRRAGLAYEHGWREDAADAYARFTTAFPGDERALTGARLRGQALYELERFDDAGNAYATALSFARTAGADSVVAVLEPLLPHCRFRHGEQALDRKGGGAKADAAGIFEDTASRWPEWEHADRSLYRAGLAWDDSNEASDAVRAWSALVDRYPESEYARDALLKTAETWERAERHAAAADAFRRFSETYPDDADASAALLTAATLLETSGDGPGAERTRDAYLERFPDDLETAFAVLEPRAERELAGVGPDRPISALLSAATAAPPSALRRYLDLSVEHDSLASRGVLAQVRFQRGEEARRDYEHARLSQPLEPAIAKKKSLLENALEEYRACSAYGVVPWNRAAAFRIGECLVGFGDSLMESERPADLGGDDLAAYEEVLEERSWDFWDRGEETWTGLVRHAEEGRADGEWLGKARSSLWPRVAKRFVHRPEFEHPVIHATAPSQENAR